MYLVHHGDGGTMRYYVGTYRCQIQEHVLLRGTLSSFGLIVEAGLTVSGADGNFILAKSRCWLHDLINLPPITVRNDACSAMHIKSI